MRRLVKGNWKATFQNDNRPFARLWKILESSLTSDIVSSVYRESRMDCRRMSKGRQRVWRRKVVTRTLHNLTLAKCKTSKYYAMRSGNHLKIALQISHPLNLTTNERAIDFPSLHHVLVEKRHSPSFT